MSTQKEAVGRVGELSPLTRELDANLLYEYYRRGNLGTLHIAIPRDNIAISEDINIRVELDKLFEHVTNLKSFEERTRPDSIEAICVYGSVLFKQFGTEEVVREERRKFVLFGPKQVKEQRKTRYKTPRDFDILVILKEGLTEDRVIVPKRTTIKIDTGYGYFDIVKSNGASGILTEVPVSDGIYGYIEGYVRGGDLDLHISYRSVEQLLAGIGHGDELSESVIKYGVPLIGQERFNQLVASVTSLTREPLHGVQWSEDKQGKLQGRIT